jgi:hypothetical protein
VEERKRRIGENEAVFRSVNEQISGLTGTLSTATETMSVVCECGARSCTERFDIEPDVYGEIREDPTLFMVKPGHDLPETETVVAKRGVYWIVKKDPGGPAQLARETDPRT